MIREPRHELFRLTRGQRLRYGAAILSLGIATFFNFLVPLVGKAAIDGVDPAVEPGSATGLLALLPQPLPLGTAAALMVSLTLVAGVFYYLKGRWSATAAERIAKRMRESLYEHLQRLPCEYHDQADTGDLVQRCTSDVETVRLFLAEQVVEVGRSGLMLLIVVPLLYSLDPQMTLVATFSFPLVLGFAVGFFRRAQKAFLEADEAEGEMTTALHENLTGVRVVRAFGRADHESSRFAVHNARYRDRTHRWFRLLGVYWFASDFVCVLQLGVVLIFGASRLQAGTLGVGTLFAFLTYEAMVIFPLRHLGRIVANLGKAAVAIGRIGEVLSVEREAAPERGAEVDGVAASGELVVEGLRFAYERQGDDDGREPAYVLDDVSFRLRPGETLALLGPPGAGKSTLVHLLLGFYHYQHGSVRLDGRELDSIERSELRGRIGAVLQDSFLYSKSVRENVRLGRATATDDEVVESSRTACLHDDVDRFEKGYETLVGERGVTLSGGQRQRVALARAILREPPVLILDDALSAVDSDTEERILTALERRHGRRTTLVIAHRLSTLARADRILVLDEGRVVQQGSHAELSEVDGPYRRLWLIQSALEGEMNEDEGLPEPGLEGSVR